MSWWSTPLGKRLRKWWDCTQAPLPPEETIPDAQESELEDDPDVQQMKQAVETQITELLRAHPEAAPRVEAVKREAEQAASRWLETQRRVWATRREANEPRRPERA